MTVDMQTRERDIEDRLVQLMIDEGRRFDAESAWRERDYPPDERERRQIRIIIAELRVINNG